MKTIEKFVKRVISAAPTEPLAGIARMMDRHNVGAVVIVENYRPVGILTDRDIAIQFGAHGKSLLTPASAIMSTPIKQVHRDEGIFDTTHTMMEAGVRRLPVVDDDGHLAGLVTLDDLFRVLVRELGNLAEGIKLEMEVK